MSVVRIPVLLLLAFASWISAGAAAPGVQVSSAGGFYVLDNGIVRALVSERTGDLQELIFRGRDRLGHDQGRAGNWEQDPSAAARVGGLTHAVTIDPAGNGGERAEVAIKGVTHGDPEAGLSPGSPGAARSGTVNLDLEIRYALGRGDSGVYTYAIFSHPGAYGALVVPESRFITHLDQSFDWLSVDADRNLLECAPRDWGTGIVVHAKEQRILTQGVYRHSVEHKYSYNAVQYKVPAFGWSSTREHVGVWFINPSIEYLSGGAAKQELLCHYGDNGNPDPIILDYWRGTHYGGGAPCFVGAGESWSKVVGPIFIYANALDSYEPVSSRELADLASTAGNPVVPRSWTHNATRLWQDALRQAREETRKWPYDWVRGVDYPQRAQRGIVSGRLVLDDPQASSRRLAHLTVGLAFPDSTEPGSSRPRRAGFFRPPQDWVHDSKHYQFWTDGSEDGRFEIKAVRPGRYTLHAFADGVLGEYAHSEVTVGAGANLNLGTLAWTPLRYGRQVWEIGYPDRTGGKFFKGDGANYWLWGWCLRYPLLFPRDVTYTIGRSDYRRDWFFEQVPHGEAAAWIDPAAKDPANQRFGWVKAPDREEGDPWRRFGRGRATTWTIRFALAEEPKGGQAALRVALAGANTRELAVGVNGGEVGVLHPVVTDAIRYNTDKSVWQELTQTFTASRLRAGANSLTLTVPAGDLTSGVVYDYLRLELAGP